MADDIVPCVYWLYDATCTTPETSGYVGITVRGLERRIWEHRRTRRFPEGFIGVILFTGTRDECLAYERQMRAAPRVGWNRASGGAHFRHSEETRARIGAAATGKKYCLGRKLTEEQKKKIGDGIRGWKHSEETRQRMRIAQAGAGRGRKLSPEHRAKISAGLVGHSVSETTKAKLSAAHKGHKRGFGRKFSPETRAKISASNKGKHDYSHTAEAKMKIGAAARNRSPETLAKIAAASRARRHTKEAKAKIGAASRARWRPFQLELF